jgi:hypothetical protein
MERYPVPTAIDGGLMDPSWIIATASVCSAALAIALAVGLRDWVFRPRVRLILQGRPLREGISDRVVTRRIDTGRPAAFVRLRVDNRGRSTARRVGVRVLQVHYWDQGRQQWIRVRPELDGRLLQPSNQLPGEPGTVDVFPGSDRIVDLVSIGGKDGGDPGPVFIEISEPWPPNRANALETGVWRLDLSVSGDNINAEGYFITVSFDGAWPEMDGPGIWDHLRVDGPSKWPGRPSSGATAAMTAASSDGSSKRDTDPDRLA